MVAWQYVEAENGAHQLGNRLLGLEKDTTEEPEREGGKLRAESQEQCERIRSDDCSHGQFAPNEGPTVIECH